MAVGIFINRGQAGGDTLLQAGARNTAGLDMVIQFLARVGDKGKEAGALVGIVQIESAVPQPRLAGNVLRPGCVIAALDEQFARRQFQPRQTFRLAASAARAFDVDSLTRHDAPTGNDFRCRGRHCQRRISVYSWRYRTRESAAIHPVYRRSRSVFVIAGRKRRSSAHRAAISFSLRNSSAPKPARYAAPSAVVSVTLGRSTVKPVRSARR